MRKIKVSAELENVTDDAPVVEYRSVNLTRGATRVLDSVSAALPARATTAVLGASGSGKSTLIQLAIGLLIPDSGDLRVLGSALDYDNLKPLRRRMGYAIQDVALLPHLRVHRNVALPAELTGWTKPQIDERVAELAALMELPPDLLERYPHQLSGGQQQRAGICRAMILRPELLLLDEPFSGLDAMTRQAIHERFLELQASEGVATLLVTHDPQEAINLANYMVVLRDGRVLQQGTVEDVIANPMDSYVRKLCTGLAGVHR